jgi:hypothetical protein
VSSEWGVQLLTTLPLAYICVATYFALFRVNAFDYNKLLPRWGRPGRALDALSVVFGTKKTRGVCFYGFVPVIVS